MAPAWPPSHRSSSLFPFFLLDMTPLLMDLRARVQAHHHPEFVMVPYHESEPDPAPVHPPIGPGSHSLSSLLAQLPISPPPHTLTFSHCGGASGPDGSKGSLPRHSSAAPPASFHSAVVSLDTHLFTRTCTISWVALWLLGPDYTPSIHDGPLLLFLALPSSFYFYFFLFTRGCVSLLNTCYFFFHSSQF